MVSHYLRLVASTVWKGQFVTCGKPNSEDCDSMHVLGARWSSTMYVAICGSAWLPWIVKKKLAQCRSACDSLNPSPLKKGASTTKSSCAAAMHAWRALATDPRLLDCLPCPVRGPCPHRHWPLNLLCEIAAVEGSRRCPVLATDCFGPPRRRGSGRPRCLADSAMQSTGSRPQLTGHQFPACER